MFDLFRERKGNQMFLKAIEDPWIFTDVLDLPPISDLGDFEEKLKMDKKLQFSVVFHDPTGLYLLEDFLTAIEHEIKVKFARACVLFQKTLTEKARKPIGFEIFDRFMMPQQLLDADDCSSRSSSLSSLSVLELDDSETEINTPDLLQRSLSIPIGLGSEKEIKTPDLLQRTLSIPIGLSGFIVTQVEKSVERGEFPQDLFASALQVVLDDIEPKVFPQFLGSKSYLRYIQAKWGEAQKPTISDFLTLRLLGRGAYGAVYACCKKGVGTLYAIKCMDKKRLMAKKALKTILAERELLPRVDSRFVTNLKYALQDDSTLYLVFDLMLGGDLKYHLANTGYFSEPRARFYAAEVLLGLEAIHRAGILYRDLKLENVLLDQAGHCKLSDFGLAVKAKTTSGYAGTLGYAAPELLKGYSYGFSVDIFSFGVFLYRMLSGLKPFPEAKFNPLNFPEGVFSSAAIDLLTGLLDTNPRSRLGCGKDRHEEIKRHPFFETIDWEKLEAGEITPPFAPQAVVNARSLSEIGDFQLDQYKDVILDKRFTEGIADFEYAAPSLPQEEMIRVLQRLEEKPPPAPPKESCCTIA